MTLDEWVDYLKNAVGAPAFKGLGVSFLREHFGREIHYSDGRGDGGVDAWVIFQSEPPVRAAAQFHAGRAERWDQKLSSDLAVFCAQRDQLPAGDSRRLDFARLFFVCAQTPAAADVETTTQDLLEKHGVRVQIFDARAIASLALERRGSALWRELVRQLPGATSSSSGARSLPRDEALLTFAFLHEHPAKYRQAVAKSAVATVLHRHGGSFGEDELLAEGSRLLRVSEPSSLVSRALRDLRSEGRVEVDSGVVKAKSELSETTAAALALATHESERLRLQCVQLVEPLVPAGRHHRTEIATRAVGAVFADLGVLIRQPIEEQVLFALDPTKQPESRYERAAFERWRTVARRFEQELGIGDGGPDALATVVSAIAQSPFAQSLAAAELFLDLTEHDGHELGQALASRSQRVVLDTTIALPMMCSLFDEPVATWRTSAAAAELHHSLEARGARCIVPSVYLEEIAAHLLRARDYADVIEVGAELDRSRNFFVAHFCSVREVAGRPRARGDFLDFLASFGAPEANDAIPFEVERARAERRLRGILARYGIEIESVDEFLGAVALPQEPAREPIVIRHDRAVVTALRAWSRHDAAWIVCTADAWLRSVLNAEDFVALDSHALLDLLELVRPTETTRALAGALELASAISEQERELAAGVWDVIVGIERSGLRNRELAAKAQRFRDEWIERQHQGSVAEAWVAFRASDGPQGPSSGR